MGPDSPHLVAPVTFDLDLASAARTGVDEVLAQLRSTTDGLTSTEAARRQDTAGRNVLATRRVTAWGVLVRQLRNPLLILLLGAAAVSGVTGDTTDALIIAAIVGLSIGLGFFNEYRSELAAAALHDGVHHQATAWRDGAPDSIDVAELVPGDVIDLALGTIVPADVRLLTSVQFECDEGVLTGESVPAAKNSAPATDGESPLDLRSCGFMGTIVHQGSARAVVVATGSRTAFGQIAVGLSERPAVTAFQVGLKQFSRLLVGVAAVLTISIFVINIALRRPLIDALLFSLAIAIGITPQLLPAIVSVSLSSGSRQLAKRRVLVKRLVTIEDLGNIELLFTDKTGTLTEGTITFGDAIDATRKDAANVLALGRVCNEATMSAAGPTGGNALDRAVLAAPARPNPSTLSERAHDPSDPSWWQRFDSLPFDHDRQLASVLAGPTQSQSTLIVKGAPEVVLARCVNVPDSAAHLLQQLFDDGARVVAVATRILSLGPTLGRPIALTDEHDLTFEGFLTFVDRPKADAGASIRRLGELGIDVKIITGDNGAVAAKVCRDIGIELHGTITGTQIAAMDDDQLAEAIPQTTIFSRVGPDQKARVVKVARRTGVDVAFLGDGVNDAVALHVADVGISVDSATDVAKDAADIVLMDKDLGVLAEGVTEGRRIFANTLKYVLMATSSNFGNMFSAAGASLFLTFLPMLPSQILLNNLLYDVGQLAIPTDRVDPEILARPSAWDIHFVRRFMITFGPISSLFDFSTFLVMIFVLHASHSEFRSGWFVESIVTQTLVVFLIRTRRVPFFTSRPSAAMIATPAMCAVIGVALPFSPLASVLGFTTLPLAFFLILIGMALGYLVLIEFAKSRFYAAENPPERRRPTHDERHRHHVKRRAARFVDHRAGSTLRADRERRRA